MAARTQPPGSPLPRAAQLLRLIRDEPGLLRDLQARHGDVFQLKVERRPWNVLAHPRAIKQVFQSPPDVLHAGDANEILRPALGPNSILVLDEGEHMRQCKPLLPAFHGERLQAQAAAMREVAERQVRLFPEGVPFSLRDHTQAIAREVVVLGVSPDDPRHDSPAQPFLQLLDWFADTKNLLTPTLLGPDHTSTGVSCGAPTRTSFGPSAGSRATFPRTPGSRSAAGCGAASAPRSPSSSRRSCCARSRAACTCRLSAATSAR